MEQDDKIKMMESVLSNFSSPFKSPEECFEAAAPMLKKKFAELAEEAMDNFYFKYLPHVDTDADSNAYYFANEKLLKLLEGRVPAGMGKPDAEYQPWRAIRKKILEENKEEILAAIGADKDREIERLNKVIADFTSDYR